MNKNIIFEKNDGTFDKNRKVVDELAQNILDFSDVEHFALKVLSPIEP